MTKYLEEVNRGMQLLAAHPKTVFIGQAIEYPGTAITHQIKSLAGFGLEYRKWEMPVAEDFQAGVCLGLALEGWIPVCIYPRFNFALLATNQIVNHIDKWGQLTEHKSKPNIIFKIAVGSNYPLDPGPQHQGNYTQAFKLMCESIDVIELNHPEQVVPTYKMALERTDGRCTMIIEHAVKYSYKELWAK